MTASDVHQKIATFFARYPIKTLSKRQIIMNPGTPLPGVFYIVEGRVSQYDITASGNEVVVNVFKPHAFFPMSWVMNNMPNTYFFEASTPVVVHVAPAKDVIAFVQDNPDVMFDLLTRVYRGTDGILRRMAHLMGGDAQSRLLFELLNAGYRFGELQKDGKTIVPIKETDLARHSGLARETVNRNLQRLKAAHLLEVSHSGFVILDLSALEAKLNQSF